MTHYIYSPEKNQLVPQPTMEKPKHHPSDFEQGTGVNAYWREKWFDYTAHVATLTPIDCGTKEGWPSGLIGEDQIELKEMARPKGENGIVERWEKFMLAFPKTAVEEKPLVKGVYMGLCNRTSCQKPPANYYNHSTRKYYCSECAMILNHENKKDAMRIFGHDLCTIGQPIEKAACTCNEFSKQRALCPVCDKDEYTRVHQAINENKETAVAKSEGEDIYPGEERSGMSELEWGLERALPEIVNAKNSLYAMAPIFKLVNKHVAQFQQENERLKGLINGLFEDREQARRSASPGSIPDLTWAEYTKRNNL